MTKNCCPGFALDFPFNKDSAGFTFFTFTPYTLNFSFRARAAYQLRNVSHFDYRITYEQPAKKRSYLMQSVVFRLLSNLLLLLSILLRMHSSKKLLLSRNFQIYHTIVKCTTLFPILLHSSLIIPRYSKWCAVVRSIVHVHKDLRIRDEVSGQKQVSTRATFRQVSRDVNNASPRLRPLNKPSSAKRC